MNKKRILIMLVLTIGLLFLMNVSRAELSAEEDPLFSANFNMSADDFTAESILIDPELATGTGNFGGHFYTLPVASVETEAYAIRVKNLTPQEYPINTLYLHCVDNFSYSLMASKVTFITIDGKVSSYKAGTGGRNTVIPANFDGVMVIPWSEMVNVRAGGDYNWTYRSDEYKLSKTNSAPDRSYPTKAVNDVALYFDKLARNAEVNELLVGTIYTLTLGTEDEVNVNTYPNVFKSNTTVPNVLISTYPDTCATYSFQVNGVDGVSDQSINLNIDNNLTLKYGYSFTLTPTLTDGYVLSYVDLNGTQITDYTIYNSSKEASNHVVNVVTTESYNYKIGTEDTISLQDKTGVLVNVDNGLNEAINYSFIMTGTDGTQYTATSQGNGIFVEEGGNTYYGNVFSIPAGFKGQVFIPFNVYRGSVYGGVNNLPFDVDQPDTVQSTIRLSYVTTETITKSSLETVFDEWQFVTTTPELTLAPAYDFASDNLDFANGAAISLDNPWLNYWTSAPALKVNPTENISIAGLGMGFRVRNIGQAEVQLRIYIIGSNNAWYVPNTAARYHLINADGSYETKVTNRNVVIPAGFDGTVVVSFADYATDTIAIVGQKGSNVVRTGINVKEFNFFINAPASNHLLIASSIVNFALDDTVSIHESVITSSNSTLAPSTRDGVTSNVLMDTVSVNSIVTKVNDGEDDGTKVTVSHENIMFGDELVVTPKEGFMIEKATLNGVNLTQEADGSFTTTVFESFEGSVELNVTVIEKTSLVVEYDSTFGSVKYMDQEVSGKLYFDLDEVVTLVITPIVGYQVKFVKAGEEELTGVDGAYEITLSVSKTLSVQFELIAYAITYDLAGGVNHESNPTSYTVLDSFILSDPSKDGYEFLGWYTFDENNERVDALRVLEGTTGELKFYAEFKEIEEPVDPTPNDPKPSGCKAFNMVWFFIIPLMAVALLGVNKKLFK